MHASFDTIVIGGGAAGVAAALSAARAGENTALVRAAPGATALSSGAWIGPLDDMIARALGSAGLPYVRASQRLPHPFGDLRVADFAAASHAFTGPIDDAVLCGIDGFNAFSMPSLSRMYATSAQRPLPHVIAVMPGTPRAGWSPVSLAAAIERDPLMLADALRPLIPASASFALLPAVLGIEQHAATRAAIAERIGIPVFEMLGAPPSIPGWRLDIAFMRALRTAGVQVVTGIVHGCDAHDRIAQRIHVSVNGAPRTLNADRFVLASGKFLGGGVATVSISAREQALVETSLGLPVWIEHLDKVFENAESLTLTSRVRTYDQPLLRAGVHTNELAQPVDARDRVVYRNVVVAGSLHASSDAQHGLGHAAQDGIRTLQRREI
jgi:glycerol-3-phosphate dehydrogenase subunit B